jgi:hypothetical protein
VTAVSHVTDAAGDVWAAYPVVRIECLWCTDVASAASVTAARDILDAHQRAEHLDDLRHLLTSFNAARSPR